MEEPDPSPEWPDDDDPGVQGPSPEIDWEGAGDIDDVDPDLATAIGVSTGIDVVDPFEDDEPEPGDPEPAAGEEEGKQRDDRGRFVSKKEDGDEPPGDEPAEGDPQLSAEDEEWLASLTEEELAELEDVSVSELQQVREAFQEARRQAEAGGDGGEGGGEELDEDAFKRALSGKIVLGVDDDGKPLEFRDGGHLLQAFKTLRGQYKPILRKVQEATELAQYNYDATVEWQKRYNAKVAELEALRGGKSAPASGDPATGTSDDPIADLIRGVDVSDLDAVKEQYGEAGALKVMLYRALQGYDQANKQFVTGRLDEVQRPFREAEETGQNTETLKQSWEQVAGATDQESGEFLYPELRSEESAKDIAEIWKQLRDDLIPEARYTIRSVLNAVAYYRAMHGHGNNNPVQEDDGASDLARRIAEKAARAAKANKPNAIRASGPGNVARGPSDSRPRSKNQDVVSEMDKAAGRMFGKGKGHGLPWMN